MTFSHDFIKLKVPITDINLVGCRTIVLRKEFKNMFREILQYMACFSVFTSVLSTHVFDRSPSFPQLNKVIPIQISKTNNESPSSHALNSLKPESRDMLKFHVINEPVGPDLQYDRKQQFLTSKIYGYTLHNDNVPNHWIHFAPYITSKKRAMTNDAPDSKYGQSGSIKQNSKILPTVSHGIANQLMLRSARGQRQYDVPQIGE